MRDLPEVWCRILPEAFETPAVDVERDAGDEAGALGAEERDRIGQLVRTAPAPKRVLSCGEPSRLVLGGGAERGAEPGTLRFHIPVSTQPGQTALTRTLSGPSSVDSAFVTFSSALLVMPLPSMYGSGSLPAPPMMLTMRPHRRARMPST